MIQRIQTIYLALVAVFSILGLCLPIGQFYEGTHMVATYNNFMFVQTDQAEATYNMGPIALGILLIIVTLITMMSIMLFRHRMRQLRLTIFTIILLAGYIGYYAFLTWKYQLQMAGIHPAIEYHLCIAAILPLISIILSCLAIHGIRRDEAIVRSLDRLR